jgi:hypothetical protein
MERETIPGVSPEDEAQVLQFLSELSSMRDKDPSRFKEVMSSLGVEGEDKLADFDLSSLTSSIKDLPGLQKNNENIGK